MSQTWYNLVQNNFLPCASSMWFLGDFCFHFISCRTILLSLGKDKNVLSCNGYYRLTKQNIDTKFEMWLLTPWFCWWRFRTSITITKALLAFSREIAPSEAGRTWKTCYMLSEISWLKGNLNINILVIFLLKQHKIIVVRYDKNIYIYVQLFNEWTLSEICTCHHQAVVK